MSFLVLEKVPKIFQSSKSYSYSSLALYMFTRQVPLGEQELLTLPEHLSSTPVFSGFAQP